MENWKTNVSSGTISAQARYDIEKDVLYVGTLNGFAAAVGRGSGSIRWRRKLPHAIFSSPVILHNGNVVYATVSGTLFCLNVSKDTEVMGDKHYMQHKIIKLFSVHNYRTVKYSKVIANCIKNHSDEKIAPFSNNETVLINCSTFSRYGGFAQISAFSRTS